MIQLGDITKISGYTAPPVNVIIGGSPCQDLSVAGRRAGLEGERSGLFMEQIRIIKEMREQDVRNGRANELIRPRFMVWENVPGAFSSNKSEDFRIVLEETARIVDKTAVIPRPPKGKWTNAGAIMGSGWSIAWRVLDAQFWGVPQRRRRIALVADFGGESAPEILFERAGVSGNLVESGAARKAAIGDTKSGIGTTDCQSKIYDARGNGNGRVCPTLTGDHESRVTDYTAIICMATQQGGAEIRTDGKAPTLTAAAGMSGNNQPVICIQGNCIDRSDTAGCNGRGWTEDVCYTLNTIDRPAVVYAIDRVAFNQGENAKYDFDISDSGINSTLVGRGPSAVAYAIGNGQADQTKLSEKVGALNCMHDQQAAMYAKPIKDIIKWIVRRLTPLECERLQGFPDGWTDIGEWTDGKGKKRKTTDSARYKALGNSIAIPPWAWILQRLSLACRSDRTMASLFDGIGGFPLIWKSLNGAGFCLWASEIDEFCVAVTERRFEDEADFI